MCGLKRRVEVERAVELGVDAVGLVFYPPSSRAIAPQQLNDVVGEQLAGTKVVGLFVNPTREEVFILSCNWLKEVISQVHENFLFQSPLL